MDSTFLLLVVVVLAATTVVGSLLIQIFSSRYLKYQESYVNEMSERMENIFFQRNAGKVLLISKWVTAFVLGLVGVWLSLNAGSPITEVVGLSFGVAGFFLPDLVPRRLESKRLELFGEQLPDTLVAMASCLKSGLAFPQAVEFLVHNTQKPTSEEFALVTKEIQVGVSVDDALNNMLKRLPSEDLELLVTAVTISRQVGGNLVEVFDTMARTIRERSAMEGKIKALTAQGKMQTLVIGAMPLVMYFLLRLMQPEMMANLTQTAIGWILIVLIVIWEAIGLWVIQKIVTIEV
jgi:tight adherence protein B